MICAKCGAEADDKKWFCPVCSVPLHEDEDIVGADSTSPGERTAPPDEETEPTPDPEPVEGAAPGERVGRGFLFKGKIRREWIIRIAITILILAILIAALLIISRLKWASGMVGSAAGSMIVFSSCYGAALRTPPPH